MKNFSKGFTLIELLVVISIIGVLSSVVLMSVKSAKTKAQASRLLVDEHQMQNQFDIIRDQKNDILANITDLYCGFCSVSFATSKTMSQQFASWNDQNIGWWQSLGFPNPPKDPW